VPSTLSPFLVALTANETPLEVVDVKESLGSNWNAPALAVPLSSSLLACELLRSVVQTMTKYQA